jgi:hypothetical protein
MVGRSRLVALLLGTALGGCLAGCSTSGGGDAVISSTSSRPSVTAGTERAAADAPTASTGSDSSRQVTGSGGVGPLGTAVAGASSIATITATQPASVTAPGRPAATSTRAVVGAEFVQVSTPGKNIGCMLSATQVRCDILIRSWADPPVPPNCDFDYGSSVYLGLTGPAALACVSDTVVGGADVLRYGTAIRFKDFECVSTSVGVDCRELRTGHGFTLARASYLLF